jgi:hypothetical protein
LAKDSTKQLFDKDYNWLDVLLSGLMKAKIRNEMIEEVPFSTASAVMRLSQAQVWKALPHWD